MSSMQRHIILIATVCLILVALYTTLVAPADFSSDPFTAAPDDVSGNLYVTSEPEDAAIFIDDSTTGQITPHLFIALPPGIHTVMVTKEGYYRSSSSIEVVTGKTVTINFILIPITFESKMPSAAGGNSPPAFHGGGWGGDSSTELTPDNKKVRPIPEFLSITLPMIMITGFIAVIMRIKKRKDESFF